MVTHLSFSRAFVLFSPLQLGSRKWGPGHVDVKNSQLPNTVNASHFATFQLHWIKRHGTLWSLAVLLFP